MDKKHNGAKGELLASVWLLEQGYEVFSNVSQHGAIDIIARHPETKEILLIDVTTGKTYLTKSGSKKFYKGKKLRDSEKNPDIKVLNVTPDGCFWNGPPSSLEAHWCV